MWNCYKKYNTNAGVLVLCKCVQVGGSSGKGLSEACWMMGASALVVKWAKVVELWWTHSALVAMNLTGLSFQMFPQTASPSTCKLTLICMTFLRCAPSYMILQNLSIRRSVPALVAFVRLFSRVFSDVSSNSFHVQTHSHISCICMFSQMKKCQIVDFYSP